MVLSLMVVLLCITLGASMIYSSLIVSELTIQNQAKESTINSLLDINKGLEDEVIQLNVMIDILTSEIPISPSEEVNVVHYVPTMEELTIMAKIIYREARGIPDKAKQAAVVWCILNRVDAGFQESTIISVATYPGAFAYYYDTPIQQEFLELAEDVINRWSQEKSGATDVGRTLPQDYLFFTGDGVNNNFTKEWKGTKTWDWGLENPY